MAGMFRYVLILAIVCTPAASAYANNHDTRSVTIPISVMLLPDPNATRTAAVDCAMRKLDAPSQNEWICNTRGNDYDTSRKGGNVTVTVRPI